MSKRRTIKTNSEQEMFRGFLENASTYKDHVKLFAFSFLIPQYAKFASDESVGEKNDSHHHHHHLPPWIRSLTCSGIDALPSFPGASTISSSSRFAVEGVCRQSGVVHSFEVVDPVLFVFESHVLYSREL